MKKAFLLYAMVAALLHGGHFLLCEFFPQKFSFPQLFLFQSFLFLAFVCSDLLIHFLSRYLKVYEGQLFLLTTTVKIIGTASYLLILQKLFHVQLSKYSILLFMVSYFLYLGVEVTLLVKKLNKTSV